MQPRCDEQVKARLGAMMAGSGKILQMAKVLATRLGRLAGLEIHPNTVRHRADLRLSHFLNDRAVDVVLDIGANRGQFAEELFAAGYRGKIVSFEPLPSAHSALTAKAKRFDGRWIVAPAFAVSDRAGTAEFMVTGADASSSLLSPTAAFVADLPAVAVVERIQVRTETLDVAAQPWLTPQARVFVKIDVQGAEHLVFKGGQATLARAHGLMVEANIHDMYGGQIGTIELLQIIAANGFELWDMVTAYRHPISHRTGCVDLVAFRPDARSS